jgi:hypothetical protein
LTAAARPSSKKVSEAEAVADPIAAYNRRAARRLPDAYLAEGMAQRGLRALEDADPDVIAALVYRAGEQAAERLGLQHADAEPATDHASRVIEAMRRARPDAGR